MIAGVPCHKKKMLDSGGENSPFSINLMNHPSSQHYNSVRIKACRFLAIFWL